MTYLQFVRQFITFRRLSLAAGHARFDLRWRDRRPQLKEDTRATGFDRHYVYHTAWAARVLACTRPQRHIDIGSSLYFASLVSAFVPVSFYDYRPADLSLDGLECGQADLSALPFATATVSSLSCMHVVEHIGLGRYGDPVDPDADLRAAAELTRVLAPGGSLLFVVPVGSPRLVFNRHRIYSYTQVVDMFPGLALRQRALIPEAQSAGPIRIDPPVERFGAETYGCGCFWFERASPAGISRE